MSAIKNFGEIIEEAQSAPIAGWDFSWLEGRATEDRPSWHYSELVANRVRNVRSVLDVQSGGGELLSEIPQLPPLLVAAEGWGPNVTLAATRLVPRGAFVVAAHDDRPSLPFGDGVFDLVTSRHPIVTWWEEVARVLRSGGRFLSQQVGPYSMKELTDFFMGPQQYPSTRTPELARRRAQDAGLRVDAIREARLLATFDDVGAVVYFLRLVIWIVPDFTVEKYLDRLRLLHEQIERRGPFETHATRFLIEATKP